MGSDGRWDLGRGRRDLWLTSPLLVVAQATRYQPTASRGRLNLLELQNGAAGRVGQKAFCDLGWGKLGSQGPVLGGLASWGCERDSIMGEMTRHGVESSGERGQQPHPAKRLRGYREWALRQKLAVISKDLGDDCQHCEQVFALALLSVPEPLQ